jgi:hypothetical protein
MTVEAQALFTHRTEISMGDRGVVQKRRFLGPFICQVRGNSPRWMNPMWHTFPCGNGVCSWLTLMIFLVPRCPVPGADAGVRTWPFEALSDSFPHLYSLWFFHYQCLWQTQVCQHLRKIVEWLGHINSGGSTACNPSHKSCMSICRDMSKNHFSQQMSSVTTEHTAMCYCTRSAVRGLQCEPGHKPPCRCTNNKEQGLSSL